MICPHLNIQQYVSQTFMINSKTEEVALVAASNVVRYLQRLKVGSGWLVPV